MTRTIRRRFGEALDDVAKRLRDFLISGNDPAYAFQAYQALRRAQHSKDASLAALCDDLRLASENAGVEPDESRLALLRSELNLRFAKAQEKVFVALDAATENCTIPRTKGRTKVKRHQVVVATGSAIWAARNAGALEREIVRDVSRATGESEANTRKLLAESEHASFLQSELDRLKGLQLRAARNAKLKAPRAKPKTWS